MLFQFAYSEAFKVCFLKKKKNQHIFDRHRLCFGLTLRSDRQTDGLMDIFTLSTSPLRPPTPTPAAPFPVQTVQSSTCLPLSLCLFVCMCSLTVKSSASQRSAEGQCVCQANRWPAAVRYTLSYVAGRSAEWRAAPTASLVGGRRQGRVYVCLCVCVFRWVAEDVSEKWGSIFY